MRIALTGGSGFLGSVLIEKLSAAGHEIRALVHRHSLIKNLSTQIVRGGLEHPDALRELVEGVDAVIHAGGVIAARSTEAFYRTNGLGSLALAAAARQAGVSRFLLISSLGAREPQLSAYAASKRMGEEAVIGVLGAGVPGEGVPGSGYDILRPPAIYGNHGNQLMPLLKPLKWRLALMPGGVRARLSVIHVHDAATAVVEWLKLPAPSNRIYEIDDGKAGGRSWPEMLSIAATKMGVKPFYLKPPVPLVWTVTAGAELASLLTGEPPFLTRGKLKEMRHPDWVADSTPFQGLTGWRPMLPLEIGLPGVVQAYREHGWL